MPESKTLGQLYKKRTAGKATIRLLKKTITDLKRDNAATRSKTKTIKKMIRNPSKPRPA